MLRATLKAVIGGLKMAMLAGASLVFLVSPGNAQKMDQITITIKTVTAVDKADIFGRADFYAKVTIAGETTTTSVVRQRDMARPGWKITKKVPRGTHAVNIQMFDKDPGKPDDAIDINRVANKRDLDFDVNTGNCRVLGFADAYKCGDTIVRAGGERKKAEIRFSVSVDR